VVKNTERNFNILFFFLRSGLIAMSDLPMWENTKKRSHQCIILEMGPQKSTQKRDEGSKEHLKMR
jgi:hypothetical protein